MLSGQIIPHLADFPNVTIKNSIFDDKLTNLGVLATAIAHVDKKTVFECAISSFFQRS